MGGSSTGGGASCMTTICFTGSIYWESTAVMSGPSKAGGLAASGGTIMASLGSYALSLDFRTNSGAGVSTSDSFLLADLFCTGSFSLSTLMRSLKVRVGDCGFLLYSSLAGLLVFILGEGSMGMLVTRPISSWGASGTALLFLCWSSY